MFIDLLKKHRLAMATGFALGLIGGLLASKGEIPFILPEIILSIVTAIGLVGVMIVYVRTRRQRK